MRTECFDMSFIIKHGHFLLSSGLHSSVYNQTALISQDPQQCKTIISKIIGLLHSSQFDIVLSPAMGAVVFGYELACQAGKRFLYAERRDTHMRLHRDQAIAARSRVLVMENVITTGGTSEELFDLVSRAGGQIAGVASLVVRQLAPFSWEKTVPLFSLHRTDMPTYAASVCPLCQDHVELTIPGTTWVGRP